MKWKFWEKEKPKPEPVAEIASIADPSEPEPRIVYSPDRPEKVAAVEPTTGTSADVSVSAQPNVVAEPPKATVTEKPSKAKKKAKKTATKK